MTGETHDECLALSGDGSGAIRVDADRLTLLEHLEPSRNLVNGRMIHREAVVCNGVGSRISRA